MNEAATPLSAGEFAARLAAFTPYERQPRLAIAVSGGADSLALALLAHDWTLARGGAVVALTVDHGLRPDSAAEAAKVGSWLAARGIAHRVLTWTAAKPARGIQAAARQARRELLLAECRARGILHLLLGHQQEDQVETLLLRLAAGSGRDGLACMSAVVETPELRILRPLLDVPHARLVATLAAYGQEWIEDPSNRNPGFSRTHARAALAPLGAQSGNAADVIRSFAGERVGRETEVAALLARAVAIYPEGWAIVDARALAAAPPELATRALVRILLTVGGRPYPPRGDRLDRLYAMIGEDRLAGGRTLAGCRVVPRRECLLVLREVGAIGPDLAEGGGLWDGRFAVRFAGAKGTADGRLTALGTAGWAALAAADKSLRQRPIPPSVRPTLPALVDLEGVRAVPHLVYRRQAADADSVGIDCAFRPRNVLAGAGFTASSLRA